MTTAYEGVELPLRIAAKIEKQPDGCWRWTAKLGHGYGRGHDYTFDNTYVAKTKKKFGASIQKMCRECMRARTRRWREQRKVA